MERAAEDFFQIFIRKFINLVALKRADDSGFSASTSCSNDDRLRHLFHQTCHLAPIPENFCAHQREERHVLGMSRPDMAESSLLLDLRLS